MMLKSTSKTVICVDSDDLFKFTQECYGLDSPFYFNGGRNGASELFTIIQQPNEDSLSFAGYYLLEATEVIGEGETEFMSDIGSVLARLAYDKYIPQGNYLVTFY
jgi:hypothetical protein